MPTKKHKKPSKNVSADQATEEIVQMIAQSIASLPEKERLAAMQAFDMTATAISSRGRKSGKPLKSSASHPARKPRKGR